MIEFKVIHQSKKNRARLGILKTPHGDINTPAFVTVGTKGTVKSLTPQDLDTIGTQMVFVNTYHTVLSPGVDIIEKAGGIHTFSGIHKPIITDSGGFQVFSQARRSHSDGVNNKEREPHLVKITDDGVKFRSPIDGTKFFFTPEFSIEAQQKIGADFIVAFDECVAHGASYTYTKKATHRTHVWARRGIDEFQRTDTGRQKVYGVIQGGCFEDLRKESAAFISSLPFFGLAIGGVSVGETKKEMRDQIGWVMEAIQDDPRPRHLLGIGEFDDIMDAVAMGIDTMDCVIPTRHARMGRLYQIKNEKFPAERDPASREKITSYKEIDILKRTYKRDFAPIDESCNCYTCRHFTKAYLHHLFKQRELLAYPLATIHNLYCIEQLFIDIRKTIGGGLVE